MDLSSVNNKYNSGNDKNISFSGQKTIRDEKGNDLSRVFPPYIDLKEGEELGIELVRLANVNDSSKYVWRVTSDPKLVRTDDEFKKGAKTYFDINLSEYKLDGSGEYGYRFVVCDSKTKEVKRGYADSVGSRIKANTKNGVGEFTIASTRQGSPVTGGTMEHIFTDSWNVIHKVVNKNNPKPEDFDKAESQFERTHFNRAGGTIDGITKKLDTDLKHERYIMTTPLIGGGWVSPHMYHPANSFQISMGTGTKEDFLNLQVECFKRGKGYVLDGAFTSQGYEGLQFNHAIKSDDSKFKFWFKNPSKNGYQLATFSDIDNSRIGARIVNPKGVDGVKYDKTMPTYIQLYDKDLVSEDQLKDPSKLIKEYDIKNTEDPYQITTRQDSVLCNYFEVDPNTPPFNSGKLYGTLKEWGDLQDGLLSPQNRNFSLTSTGNYGGYTGWDGNVDLVKMNLSNHDSSPDLIEGCNQARNYMYNVARYWTEETRNALIMNVAKEIHDRRTTESKASDHAANSCLRYLDGLEKTYSLKRGTLANTYKRIIKEKKAHEFSSMPTPKSYNYKIYDDKREGTEFLNDEILNFPLESLNFSPELLAVLSTPHITPRPTASGSPTDSKTKILKDSINSGTLSEPMKNVYGQYLPALVKNIMYTIQKEQIDEKGDKFGAKKLFISDGDSIGEITPYGKYFLEMAMDDIMQFAMTESLFDKDTFPTYIGATTDNTSGRTNYKNSKLDYSIADEWAGTKGIGKRLTLNKLGVHGTSSKDEADQVAKKLEYGLKNLIAGVKNPTRSPRTVEEEKQKSKECREFIDYLTDKYYTYDPEDYKIAEAVIDQTGAGLNWRFDAAKDVGDWDEAQENLHADTVWDDVISFWKPFVGEVRKINPSSYIVAEVTSLHDFDKYNWGKYGNADKAERAFYEETGATTGSNYSTYFGVYPKLFGKNIEEGNLEGFRSIENFLDRTRGFIQPGSENGNVSPEFILGSHVFLDNHDKPRAAHLMGVDAHLFWSAFKTDGNYREDYIQRAERVLGKKYNDMMSSKAVAVAERYLEFFDKRAEETGLDDEQREIIKKAIQHLANGYKYKKPADHTQNFDRAEAFGNKPFENTVIHVMAQAKSMGLSLSKTQEKNITDGVRADMVRPYESKMIAIMELMRGTVGIPTIFSGAEFAQTGSETRSKNWALGCRNLTRHDWIGGNNQRDVEIFNKRMKCISELDKTNGMAALANGVPIVLSKKPAPAVTVDNATAHANLNEYLTSLETLSEKDLRNVCKPFMSNAETLSKNKIMESLFQMGEKDQYTLMFEINRSLETTLNDNLVKQVKEAMKAKIDDRKESEMLRQFTPEQYMGGLKLQNEGNMRELCRPFMPNADKLSRNEIFKRLQAMEPHVFAANIYDSLKNMKNQGLKDWIIKNLKYELTEVGAIYKYDEKGGGVITAMTNAYIPTDPDAISPLLTRDRNNIKPPEFNLPLIDNEGKIIAKPGTKFAKKVYTVQAKTPQYIDDGEYTLDNKGILRDKYGNVPQLDSTVTYFAKVIEDKSFGPNVKPI